VSQFSKESRGKTDSATRKFSLISDALRESPNCYVVNEIRGDYGKDDTYYATHKAAYRPLYEALVTAPPSHARIITRVSRTREAERVANQLISEYLRC
jgi:hypothetical protein